MCPVRQSKGFVEVDYERSLTLYVFTIVSSMLSFSAVLRRKSSLKVE